METTSRLIDPSQPTHIEEEHHYKVYPQRWLTLLSLFIILFVNGTSYIFYTPIIIYVQKVYSIKLLALNSIYMIYMIMYGIGSMLLSTYIIDKHGVGTSITVGVWICVIGIMMRIQINQAFWWVILSSVFCGLAQPLLYNTPPKNSRNWFAPNQRTIATTVAAFASPIGNAIGSLFPFFYIDDSILHGKVKVYRATVISSLIFLGIFLIGLSVYTDLPKTPPSKTAEEPKAKDKEGIWVGMKRLLLLRNFWLGAIIYVFLTLSFGVTAVSLSAFLDPFNFNASKVSYCSLAFTISGIVGAICHSIYLGFTQNFRVSLLVITIGSTIAYVGFFGVMGMQAFWLLLMMSALLGFLLLPIVSVGMEFMCEISYPTGEASVSGLLTSMKELSTLIITLISGIVLDEVTRKKVYLFGFVLVGLSAITIILAFLVNTTLLRSIKDSGKAKQENI